MTDTARMARTTATATATAVENEAVRRELRIAPVMTGGTSLAVWIGGVTAELYSVVNREPAAAPTSPTDVYGKLLELTATDAIVDVITGTSAGGLNGVLLATSWALRAPTPVMVGMRELWLELGSIEALLRKPSERNPPSLLRGDDYFWPQLTEVLERIHKASEVDHDHEARSTDLLVTVTTLEGEPTRRIDDLDQQLNETKQDHTLRFDTQDFGETKRWAERLALAARTSASIPGVFEASFLPIGDDAGGRPGFESDKSSFKKGRWAVDGGVLVNEPLGVALERVWKRDAGSEVRRVALFVNPTPAGAAALIDDDVKDPPSLVKVVSSSFTAPRNIGISGDIDRLREHNRLTRRAVDVRRAIGELTGAEARLNLDVIGMAEPLYERFRLLRTADSVQSMLERSAPPALVEDSTKRRLVEQTLIEASRSSMWLPRRFAALAANDPRLEDADVDHQGAVVPPWTVDEWPWGLASIEYAASVLLELIVRAYRLPVERESIPGAEQPFRELRTELGTARRRIHACLTEIEAVRDTDKEFWRQALEKEPANLETWAATCYRVWPDGDLLVDATATAATMRAAPGPIAPASGAAAASAIGVEVSDKQQTITRALGVEASKIAAIGVDLCQHLARLDTLDIVGNPSAVEEVKAIQALRSIIWPAADPRSRTNHDVMLRRLVAMHIVAVVFGDTNRRPQLVDLVEVSWSAANALDPRRKPDEKLAGTEFSRLGAFMKPSWRANDWMWGRMDGAYQLVLLLLDPVRLRQLNKTSDEVITDLRLPTGTDKVSSKIADELAYLDDSTKPVPRSLPACAAYVAQEVQRQIAKQELPYVYNAVLRSREEGARDKDGGEFRRAYERAAKRGPNGTLLDDDVDAVVVKCRIGDESAGDELGQDMLTRTGGRVAIVAANMVTGERAGVPWPAKIAAPIRQIGLAIYAVTHSTTTASKTGIGLSAALFAFAGAIIAMRLLGTDINAGFVFLASLVMLLGAALAIMRSGVFTQLPVLLALLVVALALIGTDVASIITTDAARWAVNHADPALTGDALTTAIAEATKTDAATLEWKNSIFLEKWSVATIVIIVGALSWVLSVIHRLYYSIRRFKREWRIARHDDPGAWSGIGERPVFRRPPLPWRTVVEVVLTVIVVFGILLLQKPFFAFILGGDRIEWRASTIDFAVFLAGRNPFVVIMGLVLVGMFIGVAWDRAIRRVIGLIYRRLLRAGRWIVRRLEQGVRSMVAWRTSRKSA